MRYPYILTDNSLTVIKCGKSLSILKDNNNFDKAVQALKDNDWDKVCYLLSKAEAINSFGQGRITVKDNDVFFEDEKLSGYVIEKIVQFIEEDIDVKPLLNFLDKLMDNPSRTCVEKLYSFLEHKNMPLDEDGDFYAYKAVTHDFLDKHSQKINNSPGTIVQVSRREVDDNHMKDCSYGLHAGSLGYVQGFGNSYDKIIIVKINPKDVVTVPDYDTRKLRCCKYKVVDMYDGPLPETIHEANSLPEDIKDTTWCYINPERYNYIQDYDETVCSCCEEVEDYFCEVCDLCTWCCDCDKEDETQD